MPDGLFANPLHWAILIVIVLIIFGPGKLPGVGSALGQSLREFKKASQTDNTPPAQTTALSVASAPAVSETSAGPLCSKCGAKNVPDAQFCGDCGAALVLVEAEVQLDAAPTPPSGPVHCSACQTENPSTNRFCAHCGRLLDVVLDKV